MKSFINLINRKRSPHPQNAKELAHTYKKNVRLLPDVEEHELKEIFKKGRKRDKKKIPSDIASASGDYIPNPQYDSFLESLINALCHPKVIDKAAEILLERQ